MTEYDNTTRYDKDYEDWCDDNNNDRYVSKNKQNTEKELIIKAKLAKSTGKSPYSYYTIELEVVDSICNPILVTLRLSSAQYGMLGGLLSNYTINEDESNPIYKDFFQKIVDKINKWRG